MQLKFSISVRDILEATCNVQFGHQSLSARLIIRAETHPQPNLVVIFVRGSEITCSSIYALCKRRIVNIRAILPTGHFPPALCSSTPANSTKSRAELPRHPNTVWLFSKPKVNMIDSNLPLWAVFVGVCIAYVFYGACWRLYLSPIAHIPGPRLAAVTLL